MVFFLDAIPTGEHRRLQAVVWTEREDFTSSPVWGIVYLMHSGSHPGQHHNIWFSWNQDAGQAPLTEGESGGHTTIGVGREWLSVRALRMRVRVAVWKHGESNVPVMLLSALLSWPQSRMSVLKGKQILETRWGVQLQGETCFCLGHQQDRRLWAVPFPAEWWLVVAGRSTHLSCGIQKSSINGDMNWDAIHYIWPSNLSKSSCHFSHAIGYHISVEHWLKVILNHPVCELIICFASW